MFPDLDKSSAYIKRASLKKSSLDICSDDVLKYGALYEELEVKKIFLDQKPYSASAILSPENNGVVDIKELLNLDGEEFVKMAYLNILGRMPEDPVSASAAVRFGKSCKQEDKIAYLEKTAASKEARLRGTVLTGYEKTSLSELRRYTDRDFIRNAYIILLQRKPDAAGEQHFLDLLRSGDYSDAEILHMIRCSPEGERCGVSVEGLDEAYRKRMKHKKLYSIPVIGRCLRYAANLLNINKRIKTIAAENYRLMDRFRSTSAELSHSIYSARSDISSIAGSQNAADKRISDLASHIKLLDSCKTQLAALTDSLQTVQDSISKINAQLSARESILSEYSEDKKNIQALRDSINNINAQLSAGEALLSEYSEDKKAIQMLIGKIFTLEARLNAAERSGTAVPEAQQSADVSPVHTDSYSLIDYFDFENHFRGSREHIKKVQQIYLPYFAGKKNVLDLGCGRGEFTELLKENGVGVTGIDLYEPYVMYMKSLGLPVKLGDALEYLRETKSTDGIFMGQVVEHISIDMIVSICRLAYEKLEDGCCLIMETPNPRSLAIFTECFYMDPSHQKPIHPYTLKYIAEKSGFSRVDILYTESSRMPLSIPALKAGDPDFEQFNNAMQHVSELLYGSQDYSVIARK